MQGVVRLNAVSLDVVAPTEGEEYKMMIDFLADCLFNDF